MKKGFQGKLLRGVGGIHLRAQCVGIDVVWLRSGTRRCVNRTFN